MLQYDKKQIGKLECVIAGHPDAEENPDAVAILCHGFGAPGTDLVPFASEMMTKSEKVTNVRFIFPAAPIELDPVFESRAWWPLDMEKIQQLMEAGEFREMRSASPPQLPECRQMINEVIAFATKTYQLKASKIVIGGFSQGAMLTTDVALNHEEPLGGLICWSGSLINEKNWKSIENESKLNVVQSHGTLDPILPFSGAELLRDFLGSRGHRVNFFSFDGPHTIPVDAIEGALNLIEDVSTA